MFRCRKNITVQRFAFTVETDCRQAPSCSAARDLMDSPLGSLPNVARLAIVTAGEQLKMILYTGLISILIASLIALAFVVLRARWIVRQPVENDLLKKIASYIARGAMTFLSREYRVLLPFVVLVAAVLFFAHQEWVRFQAFSFVLGAACSALAGFVGMKVATQTNSRTTQAAEKGMPEALKMSFAGGSVIGMCIIGLALLGMFFVLLLPLLFKGLSQEVIANLVRPYISSFALGASSMALFTRVGGGIFTKAADIGADLVGKLEAGIPEDDPRNPATIADNVGDNVGDVAGMGADLFESYIGTLVGCIVLGLSSSAVLPIKLKLMSLPLFLAVLGVLGSLAGIVAVRVKPGGSPKKALTRGTLVSALIIAAATWPVCRLVLGEENILGGIGSVHLFLSFIMGLATGVAIGLLTEYFTGTGKRPVMAIVKASETGPATTLITGMGEGMLSVMPVVLVIGATILASHAVAGLYGIAITALGMLSSLGIQLAVDAYGPIADNAGGLAAMAEFPPDIRHITDELDAVGNTTAAIGKGFAIGSAALTSVILFVAFKQQVGASIIDLTNIRVLTGALLGVAIPYFFSSVAMSAIGRAAFSMIQEVRRQFREKPGILNYQDEPDYDRCIDISTSSALRDMIIPGTVAIILPPAVGFLGGIDMLAGMLAGVTLSGIIMALFMSNSGGAWDNAKKMIEAGASGGKGSAAHMASIVGDTVGDPFKDTAGPSLNILIKMMTIVSLVFAPMLKMHWGG